MNQFKRQILLLTSHHCYFMLETGEKTCGALKKFVVIFGEEIEENWVKIRNVRSPFFILAKKLRSGSVSDSGAAMRRKRVIVELLIIWLSQHSQ